VSGAKRTTCTKRAGSSAPFVLTRQGSERAPGAAVAALAALPQVDAARLGAIGFCFGGTVALELARDGAPLHAAVSVHGVLGTTAPATVGSVRASLLVLTGTDDPLAPAQEVRAAKVADWQVALPSRYGMDPQGRKSSP
jgi:dienelactone hydrolase